MAIKIKAKVKEKPVKEIFIDTEFIRLDNLLKFAGAVDTGGAAKYVIQDGQVLVNGEVCTMRGKKLRLGDTATVEGKSLVIENAG